MLQHGTVRSSCSTSHETWGEVWRCLRRAFPVWDSNDDIIWVLLCYPTTSTKTSGCEFITCAGKL